MAIEIKINGEFITYEEAQKLYDELSVIFGPKVNINYPNGGPDNGWGGSKGKPYHRVNDPYFLVSSSAGAIDSEPQGDCSCRI